MVQYSNSAKTCLQSEKFGSILSAKTCRESEKGDTILKQSQKLSPLEKDGTILKQSQNLSPARKRCSAKTCHQPEKDGTILKQSQNLSAVRKRWYSTQTEPKHVNKQKKMLQYSNKAKT